MKRDVVPVDFKQVARATSSSISRREYALTAAFNVMHDPERLARLLKDQKCISCYYLDHRIAQQAFFTQQCGLCLVPQTYTNSNTNVLCLKCARQHDLCCHCGSDINQKPNRIFKGNQDATGTEPRSPQA